MTPESIQERLEQALKRHSELSKAIGQGQQQIAQWAEERLRLEGQLALLKELSEPTE